MKPEASESVPTKLANTIVFNNSQNTTSDYETVFLNCPNPLNYSTILNYPTAIWNNPLTDGIQQLIHMLANSASKETENTTNAADPTTFHFSWGDKFKEELDLVGKLSSPHYINLSAISPSSSSSDSTNLILKQIQVPKEIKAPNQCAFCNFTILDKEISIVDGKLYHHNCIRCAMCDNSFEFDEKVFVRDGLLLCRSDHAKRYQKFCRKCELPLNRDDMVMRAKEMIFHHDCFICFICGVKLNPGDYYTMSPLGHLYCHAHYNVVRTTVLCEEPTATVVAASTPTPMVVTEPVSPQTPTPVPQKAAPEKSTREPSTEAEGSTDEDGNGNGNQRSKRMRTSFKHHQLRAMKTYFALNHNPDAKDLKQLAAKTNLTKRVLQVWFQNARAKFRRGLQDSGHVSPLSVSAPLATMDLNPPLSSSSSGHSTDGYQLNTPPLSTEIYSPNNYTHL